ncbi:MAG: hypothetical protein V3R31_05405 [Candidatus Humimicrobiaceae bacterium]
MLRLLLKNRLNILFLGFTRDEPKSRAGRIIGTAIGAIVFSLILFYSLRLISFIYDRLDLELADLILNISLDYIFAIIFIIIILTGIATSFYILYMSKDLELLLSFPISYRTVFTYKIIEILITNSYLFIILIFPFLIAFGASSKIPLAYYPIMIIVFLSALSIPTSIGVFIGMLAARYINPGRAKEMFGVIGGLFAIVFFILFQIIPRFIESKTPELQSMGIESIKEYILATFDKPFLKILPSTLGSNTLSSFHNGDYSNFGLNFVLIISISVFLVFLCILLSQKLYYSGWSSSSQVISDRKRRKGVLGEKAAAGDKGFAARVLTRVNYLMIKDFKILFRTPARLMQIFIPLIIYIFLFLFILTDRIGNAEINFIIGMDTIIFLFFPLIIIGVINLRVSGSNIGGEGLNFWILKVSPVSNKKLLQIKVIFSSIITSGCGLLGSIVLFIVLRPDPSYLTLGLSMLILFSWGDSIIGTSIGTFFPEFKPAHSSKSNITFLGVLLALIFFTVYLLVFGGIVSGVLFLGGYYSWSNFISFPLIIALEFIVNIILYNGLINLSAYRLNRMEWKY